MADTNEKNPTLYKKKPKIHKKKIPFLPMKTRSSHNKTLVLDLDETLIHCTQCLEPSTSQTIVLSHSSRTLYIKYRPWVKEFLSWASVHFELVIFTASTKEYSEKIVQQLDPSKDLFKSVLSRRYCTKISRFYIKDLGKLGRDLGNVIILDNSVISFVNHLNNGIPISSWLGEPEDRELENLVYVLDYLKEVPDVRPVLESYFNMPSLYKDITSHLKDN